MNEMYEYLKNHAYISYNKKSTYQFELSEERAECIANKYDSLTDNLQQENKILKENAEHNDKVVDKVNWENMLLKKENQHLKNDINKLQKELNEENLQCSKSSIEFNDLKEKNKQIKDNWNKLKKYIKTEIPEDVFIDTEWFISILDKMQELEQELEQGRDSNE